MNYEDWWGAPGQESLPASHRAASHDAWDASRAELKRQLLEEVLPDLRGYYHGDDVLVVLRRKIEVL